jgi:hypothetical protein
MTTALPEACGRALWLVGLTDPAHQVLGLGQPPPSSLWTAAIPLGVQQKMAKRLAKVNLSEIKIWWQKEGGPRESHTARTSDGLPLWALTLSSTACPSPRKDSIPTITEQTKCC